MLCEYVWRVAPLTGRVGISAAAYHAGLGSKERQAVQHEWICNRVKVGGLLPTLTPAGDRSDRQLWHGYR